MTSSAGAGDPALAQGALERGGVDDRPAGGVHEIGGVAHRAQLGLADQAARLLGERTVQADEVGLGEQLGRAIAVAAGEENLAAETLEAPRDRGPDAPGADDPDGRAVQVAADEDVGLPGRPFACADDALALGEPAGDAASISATARSAVESVSTSGVWPTGIPRAVAAATSTLSTPTA